MIVNAYSVFDSAVGAFLPVFFARSKGEAIRSFVQAASSKDHQFAQAKGDYSLFWLGQFDDSSGVLSGVPTGPERVIGALEVGEG